MFNINCNLDIYIFLFDVFFLFLPLGHLSHLGKRDVSGAVKHPGICKFLITTDYCKFIEYRCSQASVTTSHI